MRTSIGLVVALFAAVQCFGATVAEVAENATPSVVEIVTYDITGGKIGQGSGFFIEPQKIITNAHVVEGAYSAEVFSEEGYYEQVSILSKDEDVDLAILMVDSENEIPLRMNPEAELKPGQRVIVLGNPLGLERTVSDGLISAVRTIDELQLVQITAPVSPGSSGGPLLNEDGLVIGVVSGTVREGQNLNFAIGIETLRGFILLEENPRELKVAGSRVLWRAIVKWIVAVIVGLLALAFGGGWWVILIAIMVIVGVWYLLAWIFNSVWRVIAAPFRRPRRLELNDDRASAEGEGMALQGQEFMVNSEDATEEQMLYCWKCGFANSVDDDSGEELTCARCGTRLPVPEELQNEEW